MSGHRLMVPARSHLPRSAVRRVGLVLSALAGLVVVLYGISTHVYAGGSDRATAILEGQAVSTGNPLLHGWILTRDSFWTIDAFFYGLAVHVGGLRPGLLNLEPALAWWRSPGRDRSPCREPWPPAVVPRWPPGCDRRRSSGAPNPRNGVVPAWRPRPCQHGRPGPVRFRSLEAGPYRLEMGGRGRRGSPSG